MKTSRKAVAARALAMPILAAAGMNSQDIALALGVSRQTVYMQCPGFWGNSRDEAREQEMEALYRGGMILDDIGEKFGLSRERVRQLLSRRGVNYANARADVVAARVLFRKEQQQIRRKDRWNDRMQHFYGCTLEEATAINEGQILTRHIARAYTFQKKSANYRGIGWELTLPEWWRIWHESGKWAQRGRGKGKYCMSRYGDTGPYSVDNVKIITNESNASESYDTKPAAQRFQLVRDELGMTPRQRQLHDLFFVDRLSYQEISERMSITLGSVRTGLCAIKQKTGVYAERYGT